MAQQIERAEKMSTIMSEKEFIDLIQSPERWEFSSESGETEFTHHENLELTSAGEVVETEITECHMWGWITAKHGEIEITYQEVASWEENHPEDYTTSTDHGGDVWTVTGVTVLDDDGDHISKRELLGLLEDADTGFQDIDWESLIPSKKYESVDNQEDADMGGDTITLTRDNAPDIRFEGDLIVSVRSSPNNASGSYSGSPGRWTTLRLYLSKGGRYVCHRIEHTIWEGDTDSYSATVCDTDEQVIKFFGHGWLAKELYEKAGIDDTDTVD